MGTWINAEEASMTTGKRKRSKLRHADRGMLLMDEMYVNGRLHGGTCSFSMQQSQNQKEAVAEGLFVLVAV